MKNANAIILGNHQIMIKYKDVTNTEKREKYILQSTISHIGETINNGHYIAHVKKSDKWYQCNDQAVEECSVDDIKQEEVYILAFKKYQPSAR